MVVVIVILCSAVPAAVPPVELASTMKSSNLVQVLLVGVKVNTPVVLQIPSVVKLPAASPNLTKPLTLEDRVEVALQ